MWRVPVEGGQPEKLVTGRYFPSAVSPDGKSVVYIVTKKGISNLWAQLVGGGEPGQLTNFTTSRIYSFDFSLDGKQIICARGELSGYVVLLTNK